MIVEVKNISKKYEKNNYVLKNVNLEVEEGEFITILGPSGCGKTTLLKIINKIIEFNEGNVLIKGKNVSSWDTIELRRSIGYVIQQIGLFPHMSIEKNISFVLSLNGTEKEFKKKRAEELIELVGLNKSLLNKYPDELSGGQKQRIGVARALASNPDILLMDEPFGAVDEIARTKLQDEILKVQKSLNKTILFVTHDIEEAIKLGSRIVIMKNGEIEQIGTKEEIIFNPCSKFVKEFIGIKGFKSVFSEKVLNETFEKIVENKINIEDVYKNMLSE